MFRKFINYFLQGLLFTVPLAVTAYVIVALVGTIDSILPDLIPIGYWFPGMGILILIFSITFIGILGNTVIARPINYWFNKILDKLPLIKTIYTALTDFTEAIVGGKKKKFTQPVLVKLMENVEKPGFITQEDLSHWGISSEKVMVYLPHSYGFTGNIYIVRRKNITLLDIKASEMMKTVLSGGVASTAGDDSTESDD